MLGVTMRKLDATHHRQGNFELDTNDRLHVVPIYC